MSGPAEETWPLVAWSGLRTEPAVTGEGCGCASVLAGVDGDEYTGAAGE